MAVHKRYYAAAAMEVASGVMDQALWIKARVEAGNDDDAHRLYLQLRAAELANEGLKDQAKGLVQRGKWFWHGKPTADNPDPRNNGVLATLVGGALILVIGGSALSYYSDQNQSTRRSVGVPKAASAPDPKYFYNQPIDFGGVAIGQGDFDPAHVWPGISCAVNGNHEQPGYDCDAEARTIVVAGVSLFGPFRAHLDLKYVLQGGIVLTNDATMQSLKQRYDTLLGPGTWEASNPQNHQPGWVWHKEGAELVVQNSKEGNGTLMVGVRRLSQ